MPASQSTIVQSLVRQDAKQFFLDNCGEIYEAWTSLLEKTTLPADATSSDQRILDVLVTLDAACRKPDHPRSFRLATIQLARVLNSLKEKVKKDRRRGVIVGKGSKVDASVILDIYCKATGKQRVEVYPLFKAAKRYSALGRNSLLVLTFTKQDAKIIKNTSIPISKLEAIAEEITQMYPPELVWALDYLSHDGANKARSEARLVLVNRVLEQAEHTKPKMLMETPRPSSAIYQRGSLSQQRGEDNNHLSSEGLTHEQPIALTSDCENVGDVDDGDDDYLDTPQSDTMLRSVDALSTSLYDSLSDGAYPSQQAAGVQKVHKGRGKEQNASTSHIAQLIAASSPSTPRADATSHNASQHAAIHTNALPSTFSGAASPEIGNYLNRYEPHSIRQKSPCVSPSRGRECEDAHHRASDDFRRHGLERTFQSDVSDDFGNGCGAYSRDRLASVLNSEGSGHDRGSHCADTVIAEHAYTGSYAGFALDEISVPQNTAVTEACAERPKATGFGFYTSKNNLKVPYSLASYRTNAAGWADPNASCGFCEPTVSAVKVPSKRKLFPSMCSCNDKRASYKKLEAIADYVGCDKSPVELVPQARLIGHVRVWALAQQYTILPLMELACQNMVHDLACWPLSMHTFIPILESLIQQVYDNRVTEGQRIRQIVPQFVACVAEDVSALSGWDKLLARFPAFASDYAREVTRRFA